MRPRLNRGRGEENKPTGDGSGGRASCVGRSLLAKTRTTHGMFHIPATFHVPTTIAFLSYHNRRSTAVLSAFEHDRQRRTAFTIMDPIHGALLQNAAELQKYQHGATAKLDDNCAASTSDEFSRHGPRRACSTPVRKIARVSTPPYLGKPCWARFSHALRLHSRTGCARTQTHTRAAVWIRGRRAVGNCQYSYGAVSSPDDLP